MNVEASFVVAQLLVAALSILAWRDPVWNALGATERAAVCAAWLGVPLVVAGGMKFVEGSTEGAYECVALSAAVILSVTRGRPALLMSEAWANDDEDHGHPDRLVRHAWRAQTRFIVVVLPVIMGYVMGHS